MRQECGILQGAFEAASHCRRIGKQHKMLMVTSNSLPFSKMFFFLTFLLYVQVDQFLFENMVTFLRLIIYLQLL